LEGLHQISRRQSHAVEKGQNDQSEYNAKELKDALMVVKKIMKMDAAEPFNTPVNPVALGIPDYFDIIDTPMDLGTICSALERGEKYMNSRDVFKDIQFIWENCYKYDSNSTIRGQHHHSQSIQEDVYHVEHKEEQILAFGCLPRFGCLTLNLTLCGGVSNSIQLCLNFSGGYQCKMARKLLIPARNFRE
jgi:hypothetical protein